MNIGIFGDSFCSGDAPGSWIDNLRHSLGSTATTYGKGGSTVYYSYNKIRQMHDEFDTIIWCVTSSDRLYVSDNVQFAGIASAEHLMKSDNTDTRNIAKAAIDYYLHLENVEYNNELCRLMINEIKRIVPHLLIVPCFDASLNTKFNFSLCDLYAKENRYYNIPAVVPYSMFDARSNHLTNSTQSMLADHIAALVVHGTSDTVLDDFMKNPEPKELYIR